MHDNETRNQHFVPQVEQKHAIASTLSMLDLFSFDVLGGGRVRMNLETLFHKYEANIAIHTKGLLEKLAAGSADIKTELIDLFAAKLLNFVRNPFCIQKVLNSFPGVGRYEPTDPELLAVYRRIINGQKPHQAHLCRHLDVSQETYVEWLRLIFVLLIQTGDDRPNLFEGMIKGLFGRATRRPQPLSGPTTKTSACSRIEATASPFQTARTWRCPSICAPPPSWTTFSPTPRPWSKAAPRRRL